MEKKRYDVQDVLAIKDRAMDAFMRPLFVPSRSFGMRVFRDEVNDPQSPIAKHPDDFDLYAIGLFEAETGNLVPMVPELVARGKDCVNPKE